MIDKGVKPCIPGRKSRDKPIKYDKRRYNLRIPGDMATCSDTIWPSIPEDVATFAVPLLSGGLLVSVGRSFVNGFRSGFAH